MSTSPRNMLVMQVPGSAWSRSTSGRTGQIKRFLSVRPPAYAQENSIFLNSKYQRITMNLIRQWFVFITHVFHSCVKVAYTCRLCVNGCIVLANKIHKPQGMAGVSVCFIKLVSLSPLRSCCGGRGSQVQPGLPTVWAAASTKGAIKEINVMWQPRDTYTYYWTMETYTVSERVAMWLFPGQSFNPSNSIIGYRVFPVVVFSPLSVRISSSETVIILPALTLAACRSRNKVMNAVKVESIIHLFVFHLKDHLCISMTAAPTSESNFWATSGAFKALPQPRVMMGPFLEKSHKPRLSAAQRPPILRPSAQPSRWR